MLPCFVPLLSCLLLICVVAYLLGMWLCAYVICLYVCLVLLSVEGLFVNCGKSVCEHWKVCL
jgi:hypothetical protein